MVIWTEINQKKKCFFLVKTDTCNFNSSTTQGKKEIVKKLHGLDQWFLVLKKFRESLRIQTGICETELILLLFVFPVFMTLE